VHRMTLSNGALNHLPGSHGAAADGVVETSRAQLPRLSAGRSALLAALDKNELKVTGEAGLFRSFVESLDEFDPMFNVVEP
jgi:alkyl sulfatase BDS1-like metallo-beta-lactamase superfamily hydrolase